MPGEGQMTDTYAGSYSCQDSSCLFRLLNDLHSVDNAPDPRDYENGKQKLHETEKQACAFEISVTGVNHGAKARRGNV